MFSTFLEALRKAGIQVGPAEQLVLLDALQQDAIPPSPEAFYYLARATFVKDESLIDRFDKVFAQVFRGMLDSGGADPLALPEAWLRALAEHHFSAEERARIEALGSLDAIMAALRQRLAEQHARHEGGNKWIGTGGTSPFGNAGYNPEGVRIGGQPRHGRAVKVWERRDFADFGSDREIGTRNIKLALRRLRRFARQGARSELDLDATINGTAREGYLDIHLRPERHNAIKVLLFLDVGGSMDAHVRMVEQLFSAAV
ncbi:MAG TPA: VWA domain-containing protein, partial [Novosphingobium sp.]|nr:VWA domain-containing protein [Novosphingobium sp.]